MICHASKPRDRRRHYQLRGPFPSNRFQSSESWWLWDPCARSARTWVLPDRSTKLVYSYKMQGVGESLLDGQVGACSTKCSKAIQAISVTILQRASTYGRRRPSFTKNAKNVATDDWPQNGDSRCPCPGDRMQLHRHIHLHRDVSAGFGVLVSGHKSADSQFQVKDNWIRPPMRPASEPALSHGVQIKPKILLHRFHKGLFLGACSRAATGASLGLVLASIGIHWPGHSSRLQIKMSKPFRDRRTPVWRIVRINEKQWESGVRWVRWVRKLSLWFQDVSRCFKMFQDVSGCFKFYIWKEGVQRLGLRGHIVCPGPHRLGWSKDDKAALYHEYSCMYI